MLVRPMMDQGHEHPEWLIHEDWALLQVRPTSRLRTTLILKITKHFVDNVIKCVFVKEIICSEICS